jgi:hypothetical protein
LAKDLVEVTALERYRAGGKTFPALVCALESLAVLSISMAEKQLDELLKKICLAAQGVRDSIFLETNELTAFAQFLMCACEKERDSEKLLAALKQNSMQFQELNSMAIEAFLAKSKKVVPKLVTHLQKSRNPDSGVDAYVQIPRTDPNHWVSVAEIETRNVTATDANLVGQRWFWEPSVVVNKILVQWIEVLRQNLSRDWFWVNANGSQLPLPVNRLPTAIDALSHQLLFEIDDGAYVSITPLTAVGAVSVLASSNSSKILGRRVHLVEYGGTNAQNIAAIMMDRSGLIRHPTNFPWIPPRVSIETLVAHSSNPIQLISRQFPTDNELSCLFAHHIESATNKARTSRLFALIEPLLERSCATLVQWRDFVALQKEPLTLNDDAAIFVKWACHSSELSNSEASELAETVLSVTLPNYRTRDFQRWQELVDVTQSWLSAI